MPALGNLQVEEKPIDNGELADLSEGKTLRVELPQDAALRTIYGRIEMIFQTGANPADLREWGTTLFIKRIRIKRNGNETILDVPLRTLEILEEYIEGTTSYGEQLGESVNTAHKAIKRFKIDFARNVLNENELSALQQTQNLSSLYLEVECAKAEDVGTNLTFVSGKIDLTVRQFRGAYQGRDINDSDAFKATTVYRLTEEYKIESNRTDFEANAQKIELPASVNLLKQLLYVNRGYVGNDDIVTRIAYQRARPQVVTPIDRYWEDFRESGKVAFTINGWVPVGIVLVDFQRKLGNPQGYVTAPPKYDFLKLQTTDQVLDSDKIIITSEYI